MLWESHDPQDCTNYATAHASTFYMRRPLAHNNISSVSTHSQILYHIPHPNSLMQQVTLCHHQMTSHRQQVPHLQEILRHAITYPNRYQTYQSTLIQNPVYRILLHMNHQTYLTPGILNKYNIHIISVRVKGISMNLLKISHLKVRKAHR